MREEVMGDWWRTHNAEIHDLCSSPNIIQVIISRTIRWEKHVICIYMEREEGHIECWWGNMMERNHLEDLIIDRRIMLKGMLKKYHGSAWTGLIWLRTGTSGRLL